VARRTYRAQYDGYRQITGVGSGNFVKMVHNGIESA
jgi:6-phosphogluconate dehydrogenase (decarboxylating)